ncbi:MAG: bifunctional phosphopantothenoylcysteine decarboxylase/phosphopantothenate--cysteine ligase CoaBC [Gammaproteobacteria bacterium]
MNTSQHSKVLLGIGGGIAAYKTLEIIRQLRALNMSVRVVMTAAAQQFVTPLSIQAVTNNEVYSELFDTTEMAAMRHIELAKWADVICIAPASANLMARLAHGMADDLLTTVCLASAAPLVVAPAMNQHMWNHAATQANYALLKERGAHFVGPAHGLQACGDEGWGRMVEPEIMVEAIQTVLQAQSTTQLAPTAATRYAQTFTKPLKILITAGPTHEAIDPVRYLTNHSSGKMGYALAHAAQQTGLEVTLISGPTDLPIPHAVKYLAVTTAYEMQQAVLAHAAQVDIVISAAAVADYRCAHINSQKLKKQQETMTLTLVRNPDILAQVTALPEPPFTVGFAAETEQLLEHARDKLSRKQLDMIIANNVAQTDIGFGSDINEVVVCYGDQSQHVPKMSKTLLAQQLLTMILERYSAKYSIKNT